MIIILHNIRSLYNVGSIFRTADACGAVDKIFLCGITPKPIDEFGQFHQQLTKVSLGAEKYIPWEHCASVTRLIDKLKEPRRAHKKIYVLGGSGCSLTDMNGLRPFSKKCGRHRAHKLFMCSDSRPLPLKKQGYKIFAIEQSKKSIPYYNIRYPGQIIRHPERFVIRERSEGSQIVLILGNEVKGLPKSILNRADKILEIPMRGKKESLNVAVAFGIVVFHIISPH